MVTKARLPVFTFLAVFISIVTVGALALPLVFGKIQRTYYVLQSQVNARQAKSLAQFIAKRVRDGASTQQITAEIQASITGSDMDRGYLCVISQDTARFVSHPLESLIGTSVEHEKASYDPQFSGADSMDWPRVIQQGITDGGLLRHMDHEGQEIVYFVSVPGLHWTVVSHENLARIDGELIAAKTYVTAGAAVFGLLLALPISYAARRVSRQYEKQIEEEQEQSEQLLLNILPAPIAARMKRKEKMIVDRFTSVSVLFCDIVGFTSLSARTTPENLVSLLNTVFSEFDRLSAEYGVEKIKTIGDAYMAVSGVPVPRDTNHAVPLAEMALKMMEVVEMIGDGFQVRIGLHSGDVVAGVIGVSKFSYDLWGDTVNTASRLESHGQPGKIHCSYAFFSLVKDRFEFEDRGIVELKGKGKLHTYFLIGKRQEYV